MNESHRSLQKIREDKGMSIEALAASIKVSPAKLRALEEGRFGEFPNAAFVRALAMSVCRVLKVDPRPILASLPVPDTAALLTEVPAQQPFKAGRARLNLDASWLRPVMRLLRLRYVLPLLILSAAMGLYYWPQDYFVRLSNERAAVPATHASTIAPPMPPAAEVASASASSVVAVPSGMASSPDTLAVAASVPSAASDDKAPELPHAQAVEASASLALPAEPAGARGNVVLEASGETWVQIKDANGEQLLKRLVLSGERVALSGVLPLRVKLGNAAAVVLSYQGQPVDLTAHTRANVARLELK